MEEKDYYTKKEIYDNYVDKYMLKDKYYSKEEVQNIIRELAGRLIDLMNNKNDYMWERMKDTITVLNSEIDEKIRIEAEHIMNTINNRMY